MTRVLSCIQPTGDVHLGNYLGALRPWVEGQHEKDAFHGIVDLHALTVTEEPGVVGATTLELAAVLFAVGLDPDVATVFVQSHVTEHSQLAWIMECQVSFGELSRMTQFKDKAAKREHEFVSAGLFTYPALQAADILLYDTDEVPVGEDQRQHVELTRDLAQRFNSRFGPTFTVPEPYIPAGAAKIQDLQDPSAKMSKSGSTPGGIVNLLDDPKVNGKKIRSAVTDAEREIRYDVEHKPGVSNLLTIYAALTDRKISELEGEYAGRGYGDLKKDLADVVVEFVTPFREKTLTYLDDKAQLDAILAAGAERARAVTEPTLARVYDRLGFVAGPPQS